jgi:hypothetical protein
MIGLAFALIATLLLGLIGAAALRQLRTGQSWSGLTPAPLVRLGAGFGLAFCAFAIIAVWWATITHFH